MNLCKIPKISCGLAVAGHILTFETSCTFKLAEKDCPELLVNPESWTLETIHPVSTILAPFRV